MICIKFVYSEHLERFDASIEISSIPVFMIDSIRDSICNKSTSFKIKFPCDFDAYPVFFSLLSL